MKKNTIEQAIHIYKYFKEMSKEAYKVGDLSEASFCETKMFTIKWFFRAEGIEDKLND